MLKLYFETCIVAIILSISYYMTSTLFHELGHAFTSIRYKKTKVLVLLKWKRNFCLYNNNNFKIYFTKDIVNSSGVTYLSNNYLDYSPKQIKKIAKAGRKYEYIYLIIYGFLYLLLSKQIIITKIMITLFFWLSIVFTFLIIKLSSVYEKGWNDANIIRNPNGFLEYNNNQKQIDSNKDIFNKYFVEA